MKVRDLIDILQSYPAEAEVVISKDVDEFGWAHVDKIIPGVFKLTEYGNDFFPYEKITINKEEISSVCLKAEPGSVPPPANPPKTKQH